MVQKQIVFLMVALRKNEKHFKNRYSKMSPSGRMLNKHDLFPPLKFLLENKNLDINGENIIIDGGWSITI